MVADDMLDAYPLARHRVLLDIGGGEGVFLTAAGRRHAHLRLMLFDLPAVIARARARFDAAGLSGRVPHCPAAISSLTRCRAAPTSSRSSGCCTTMTMPPCTRCCSGPSRIAAWRDSAGGRADGRYAGRRAIGDAYFGIYLAAMGSGRARACQEIGAMLRKAGFRDPRLRRDPHAAARSGHDREHLNRRPQV